MTAWSIALALFLILYAVFAVVSVGAANIILAVIAFVAGVLVLVNR